ncbi:MAG TPA: C40 family peptidase, partial [Candidatus Avimonoglobus intestinipullorum]|nr:C40 family peptidase [Candidatus Avimonoglobus intestinipullorum]
VFFFVTGTVITAPIAANAATGTDIVNDLINNYVGKYPYVLNTHGPNSFDCSGLIYYVYKQHGITLPYTTKTDWTQYGTVITDVSKLQSGDVLLFGSSASNLNHAGIYDANGGYIIHALNSKYGIIRKPTLAEWRSIPSWNSNGNNQFQYAVRVINGGAHVHNYTTFRFYGGYHPHYAYYQCSCGDIKAKQEFGYFSTCAECVTNHQHTCDKYLYFGGNHPHYKYYQCRCGEIFKNGETVRYGLCDVCIKDPGKPSLKYMQDRYASDQDITFTWDPTVNTTHYNIYLQKQIPSGEYKYYENIFYAASGTTRQLEEGLYCVILESKNSEAWNGDGSDWRSSVSDTYYFSVTGQYVPQAAQAYGGHNYLLFDYVVSWKEAKAICEALGGHLATITSLEEHRAIVSLAEKGGKDRYYLGGTDEENERAWQWVSGEPWLIDTLWNLGEPNNDRGIEHYLELADLENGGVWNDTPDGTYLYKGFICEIDAPLWVQGRPAVHRDGLVLDIASALEDSAAVYAAAYQDGKLLSVHEAVFTIESCLTQLKLTEPAADTVKVFSWDKNQQPLCEAVMISIP